MRGRLSGALARANIRPSLQQNERWWCRCVCVLVEVGGYSHRPSLPAWSLAVHGRPCLLMADTPVCQQAGQQAINSRAAGHQQQGINKQGISSRPSTAGQQQQGINSRASTSRAVGHQQQAINSRSSTAGHQQQGINKQGSRPSAAGHQQQGISSRPSTAGQQTQARTRLGARGKIGIHFVQYDANTTHNIHKIFSQELVK
jgi:hypothetical protein